MRLVSEFHCVCAQKSLPDGWPPGRPGRPKPLCSRTVRLTFWTTKNVSFSGTLGQTAALAKAHSPTFCVLRFSNMFSQKLVPFLPLLAIPPIEGVQDEPQIKRHTTDLVKAYVATKAFARIALRFCVIYGFILNLM